MASQSRLRPCVCRPSVASTFPSRSIRLAYDTRRQSGYGSKPSPPAQGWRWAAVREGALAAARAPSQDIAASLSLQRPLSPLSPAPPLSPPTLAAGASSLTARRVPQRAPHGLSPPRRSTGLLETPLPPRAAASSLRLRIVQGFVGILQRRARRVPQEGASSPRKGERAGFSLLGVEVTATLAYWTEGGRPGH
jgi:hypothetical protein